MKMIFTKWRTSCRLIKTQNGQRRARTDDLARVKRTRYQLRQLTIEKGAYWTFTLDWEFSKEFMPISTIYDIVEHFRSDLG